MVPDRVPRGNWCYILAAIGWLILANAGAGPPHKAAINSQAAEQQQQAPAPAAPAPERYRPHPDYNETDCYRDANHEAADLCAQWRAALAAEKAAEWSQRGVFVAGIGAGLSFASILLVLMALRQGRDANRLNMKEAARNTRRAVDSKEASERDLRPWVEITMEADWIVTYPDSITVSCMVTLKNIGRTPAQKIRLNWAALISSAITENEIQTPFREGFNSSDHIFNAEQGAILPGGEITDQQLVVVEWGGESEIDPAQGGYPLIGFSIRYALPNEKIGETWRSFWVGWPGDRAGYQAPIKLIETKPARELVTKPRGYHKVS